MAIPPKSGVRHGKWPAAGQLALSGIGLAIVLTMAGCGNPRAERAIQTREHRLLETLEVARSEEARRDPQMRYTLNLAADDISRDRNEDLPANLGRLQYELDRDIGRFQDRQQIYRRDFEELMRRKPETIEETAILLFL